MSKPNKDEQKPREQDRAPDEQEQEQQQETEGLSPEQDEQEAAAQVQHDVEDAIAALQRERDDLEQRLMRTAADYQNFVRRSEQNITNAREQQTMELAKRLVTVLDHFDRAIEVDPEKTSTQNLLAGVQMVRDELLRSLQQFGVERIEAEVGEAFDPNRHEALMRQPSEDIDTNHVTAQLQPGYVLKQKVVRPAKVSVAE